MYDDIDKKFESITKDALPYLILAPGTFRSELVKLMDVLVHQYLQRSKTDFNEVYGQIHEMLNDREKFPSRIEHKVQSIANGFTSQTQQMFEMRKRINKSERRIKSLEKSVESLSPVKKEEPEECSSKKDTTQATINDNDENDPMLAMVTAKPGRRGGRQVWCNTCNTKMHSGGCGKLADGTPTLRYYCDPCHITAIFPTGSDKPTSVKTTSVKKMKGY